MTLKEWKKKNNLKYEDIRWHLGDYKILWIKQVWLGQGKPGRELLLKIKKLTGLTDEEILGENK